jgi:general nucleoside transport system ATP-binding protein
MKNMAKALELKSICKSFDGKQALNQASLKVEWGEVHALLGENGAGKSTIMNVATGVYSPDDGEIYKDGLSLRMSSPTDAVRAGLGMVHQHFRLVKRFTVAENILLACRGQLGIRSGSEAARAVEEKGEEIGFPVDPDAMIAHLSVAEQQRVEILKVLLLGARIVILDEPTAVLTDKESESVLSFVRQMAQTGHAVILITHKLREVIGFSDRVTVMRQGETVLSGEDTSCLDTEMLARQMVGESVCRVAPVTATLGEQCLNVSDLMVPHPRDGVGVTGLNLHLSKGEVLGIAGVGGNGQQQLADSLMGLTVPDQGSITLNGVDVTHTNVAVRRKIGLRAIPADRFSSGLIADMTISENLGMTKTTTGHYGRGMFFSRSRMRKETEQAIADYNIAGASSTLSARLLSGGNAQKLLLARELNQGLSVLIAHSPSRGLDVKACHTVHSLIKKSVEEGAACLLISEDLEEILALSTRIAVISRGVIVGEFPACEATPEKIGVLMMNHA